MADEIERLITEASKKGQASDLSEEISCNETGALTMGDVINRRYGRRSVMQGALAVSAIGAIAGPAALMMVRTPRES